MKNSPQTSPKGLSKFGKWCAWQRFRAGDLLRKLIPLAVVTSPAGCGDPLTPDVSWNYVETNPEDPNKVTTGDAECLRISDDWCIAYPEEECVRKKCEYAINEDGEEIPCTQKARIAEVWCTTEGDECDPVAPGPIFVTYNPPEPHEPVRCDTVCWAQEPPMPCDGIVGGKSKNRIIEPGEEAICVDPGVSCD